MSGVSVLVLVVGILTAACGDSPSANSGTGQASSEDRQAPATGSGDLPVTSLDADEDGPGSLQEAWTASDWVVVGELVGLIDGVRFYGGENTAENPGGGGWYEDVGLRVRVDEQLKGSPPSVLTVNWPGYMADEADSSTRTDTLEVGGVVLDGHDIGESLVLFLKDSGPPWGLRTVSMAAGVMDVEDGERVGDQTSYGLDEHRGEPLDELAETLHD